MRKIKFDRNPKPGGLINFASNTSNTRDIDKAKTEAFLYGFRMGWQTCWHEINNDKQYDITKNNNVN